MSSTFELKDHFAIITGSAQGFGKEFAKRLLAEGGKVCISDINETLGQKTLEELQETYGAENSTFQK
jgi:NAD(P)-dependent dehydrogenase (short-subunit alcohol dehydrogenase family)